MENRTGPQIKDLPMQFQEELLQYVASYSTVLKLDGQFIGSGTLIKWGESYGILTAEHVTKNRIDFRSGSTQKLGIILETRPHFFQMGVRYLRHVTLGSAESEGWGPDVSVIVLPQGEKLGTIRAKKSFWDISFNNSTKLGEATRDNGVLAFFGHPGGEVKELGTVEGTKIHDIMGYCSLTTLDWTLAKIDLSV